MLEGVMVQLKKLDHGSIQAAAAVQQQITK
jgi:hypothetical protein